MPMRKILHRYIFKEIAGPFALILFVLTFVLLMAKIIQLMDMMVNKGVSALDIAKLIAYLMPSFLMFTIPISLLIAILIGLGRMSGDNEITVMKASGISLYQLMIPVGAASLAAFFLTAVITLFLVPQGNYATKLLLFDVAQKKASVGIKEKVFNDDFRGILIYADTIPVDGEYMEGVLISDNRIIKEPSTIVARRGYLLSDPESLTLTLRLEKGSTHVVSADFKNYRKMDFAVYDINLDIESSLADLQNVQNKTSTEMTVRELADKIRNRSVEGAVLREMAIELNKKMTIPLSCLVFGILAAPLGIRAHRAVRSRGFTIGLAIVLVYYLMRMSGEALAETGRIHPALGTWAPILLFGAAGVYLFLMAAREKSPFGQTMGRLWDRLIEALPRRFRR
jgi:lipopolysaccharide export system permease protein